MNILVTGSTGFLGGRLVQYLSEHNVFTYKADILDMKKEDIEKYNIDAAIHLVGLNDKACRENSIHAYDVNVLGTFLLLAALPESCKRVIYFSTIHVYGFLSGTVTEKTAVLPNSVYAMSHYLAEEMVRRRGSVVLRFANGFGCPAKYDTETAWTVVVNSMCKQAIENREILLNVPDGEVRNFITVTDMCRTVGHFLHSNATGVFNVGSCESIPILTMAHKVANRCYDLFGYLPPVKNLGDGPSKITDLDYRTDKLRNTGFDLLENFDEEIDNTLWLLHDRREEDAFEKGKIQESCV